MKVQYTKEEVAELFTQYQSTEIVFDLENLNKKTSALSVTLFNNYNLKLELMYFNHKYRYLYDDIDNITLQIYDNELYFLDTVNVLPFQDLFCILKQRTNEYDDLILLVLPNTKEAYQDKNTDVFSLEKMKSYSFVAFYTGVDGDGT